MNYCYMEYKFLSVTIMVSNMFARYVNVGIVGNLQFNLYASVAKYHYIHRQFIKLSYTSLSTKYS